MNGSSSTIIEPLATVKSRKEKKLQERWTKTDTTNKSNQEQMPSKTFLGVEFPPIAALRRKFSSLPPSPPILNPPPLKKKSKTFNCPSKSIDDNNNSNNNNNNHLHLSTEQVCLIIRKPIFVC